MHRSLKTLALSSLVVFAAACGPCSDSEEVADGEPHMMLPDDVELTATVTETADADVPVQNQGDAELEVSFESHADWLTVAPQELTVGANSTGNITVYGECGEEPGQESAELAVTSNDPELEETTFGVNLECEEEEVPEPGALTVEIEGLPDGVDADVTVEGPEGFSEQLDGSVQFDELVAGDYELSAAPVEDNDALYEPNPTEVTVTIESGEMEEATIAYAIVPGNLEITFSGLPEGENGEATVEGPDGFSETVEGDETFAALLPGTYTVIPSDVEVDSAIYEPTEEEVTVEIESNETKGVDIVYVGPPGDIQLEITGLPEDAEPTIELVDGAGDTVDTFPTEDYLLEEIPSGDYTVVPEDYETEGSLYGANDVDVSIIPADTVDVTVVYIVDPGMLDVTVEGLPEGEDHDIDIFNNGDDTSLASTGEATIAPGTYRLVPNPVSVGPHEIYEGDEVEDVVVESGETTEETVTYELTLSTFVVDSSGLPEDLDMRADITSAPEDSGLEGDELEGEGPFEFTEMPPGVYEVDFRTVVDSNDFNATWEPSPSGDSYDVVSGETVTADTEYSVITGDLTINIDIPEGIQVEEGEDYEIEFEVTKNGEPFDTITTDAPTTVEYTEEEPANYAVTLDETFVDKWGNEFVFDGLDEPVALSSNGDEAIAVSAPHPTQVTTNADDPSEYGSLRAIVDRVEPKTEITFADGVDDIELTEGVFELTQSVSILGDPGAKVQLAPEEAASHRIFTVAAGEAETEIYLEGLALADGDAGGDSGGAIAVTEEIDTLGIADVDFQNNTAEAGGALLIDSTTQVLTVENVEFFSNTSAAGGGAVGIDTFIDDARFDDVTFVENSAGTNGGGIALMNTDDEVTRLINVEFDNNSAERGGALFANGFGSGTPGLLIVDDATFSENTADHNGGAVVTDGNIEVEFYEASFDGNEATDGDGGAIAAEGTGALFASRITAAGNSAASGNGGALWANDASDIAVDEAHFDDNDAIDGGGLYVAENGDVDVRRALFEQNDATGDGGGAYLNGESYFENTTFSANEAGNRGGGLFFHENSVVELRHSTIVENNATEGQGIWTDDTENAALRATYIDSNGGSDEQINGPDGLIITPDGAPINSLGYNFVSEVGDYFDDDGDTDIVGESTNYSALADNGGFTETHAVNEGQNGYLDIPASDCNDRDDGIMSSDQRGFPRPSGAECSRGAWEADAYIETFESADFDDENFESGAFDGVDGRVWNYVDVMSAEAYPIEGEGARFEDDQANVSSANVEGMDGDVESLSVQYRKAGDDDNVRRIQARINGGDVVVSGDEFGDEAGEDDEIRVLEVTDLDEGATLEVEIRNIPPGGTGDVTIDNVTWR